MILRHINLYAGLKLAIKIFLVSKVLTLLTDFLFSSLVSNFSLIKEGPSFISQSDSFMFIIQVIFLAPIIETLLFNYCVQEFFEKNKRRLTGVVVSTFLFALTHCYSVYYVIYTFLIGLVFSFSYLIIRGSNSKFSSFSIIAFAHFLHNLSTLLVELSST